MPTAPLPPSPPVLPGGGAILPLMRGLDARAPRRAVPPQQPVKALPHSAGAHHPSPITASVERNLEEYTCANGTKHPEYNSVSQ